MQEHVLLIMTQSRSACGPYIWLPYLWAVHLVAVRPVVAGSAHVADHLLRVQDITQGSLQWGGGEGKKEVTPRDEPKIEVRWDLLPPSCPPFP